MNSQLERVLIRYQHRRIFWQVARVVLALALVSICGWSCWLVNALLFGRR